MIQTDSTHGATLKEIRAREKKEKEEALKIKCEQYAFEKFGEQNVTNWKKQHNGIWYLPITDEDDNIEALGVMKPITRHILSFASTKINDEGLYIFLEACMRECWIKGDEVILNDDDYFIPAANSFNKILEGKKAALLKG